METQYTKKLFFTPLSHAYVNLNLQKGKGKKGCLAPCTFLICSQYESRVSCIEDSDVLLDKSITSCSLLSCTILEAILAGRGLGDLSLFLAATLMLFLLRGIGGKELSLLTALKLLLQSLNLRLKRCNFHIFLKHKLLKDLQSVSYQELHWLLWLRILFPHPTLCIAFAEVVAEREESPSLL
ncbi:uncharacterized protein G2W53_006601 [Senna tora]|uniref:Uncharacterized protein n=1 Tax=Senna tora TaxID=362788 RepID=A0A834X4Z1_9FABA|nr:uncharacterized protein G2W53_006601 [Senna tora]